MDLAGADQDIAILWLYGSRAKGNHQADSDYDFAVAFNDFSGSELERRLRPEELSITWAERMSVDSEQNSIVDINLAPLPLAGEVINSGEVLLCKDRMRLYREENRISGMIELNWNYHRAHYG